MTWDPKAGTVDLDAMAGVDGVIHLAGAGVGDHRWTDDYKREILDSRVDGTHTIVNAMLALDPKPRVLVSASAIGWYGDTGDRIVDETAPAGTGFLADVVRAWEAAAGTRRQCRHPRRPPPHRAGRARSPAGPGPRMFPLFKLGVGGKLGSGTAVLVVDLPARRGVRAAVPARAGAPQRPGEPHRPRRPRRTPRSPT